MKVRTAALGFIWSMLLMSSCANEPFVLLPLAVTEFSNVTSGVTLQYTYRNGRMMTFKKGASTMKFVYAADVLDSIIKDSTASGYQVIRVYGYNTAVTIDSVFRFTAADTTLEQVRVVENNSDLRPSRVEITNFGSGTATSVHELDWVDGNVSEIRSMSGEVQHVVALEYDDQLGVFSSDVPFEYTLTPEEFYLLSANNPVRFKRDTLSEKKYLYHYNLKGYPSHIITDTRQVLACSYAELR